ncbi:MAG: 30S ribosomal protein S6 [Pseudobdellovibrionaceae bacterium]
MSQESVLKRPYEVVVLVHPDASLEEQKELFRKNKATIEAYNGKVHSLETWGKRNLGNHIGKLKKAIYFHSTFEANPQAVTEIERTMRINEKVLRFMHTRIDERVSLPKFLENFKKGLSESIAREKEREAKAQARKLANAAMRAEQ